MCEKVLHIFPRYSWKSYVSDVYENIEDISLVKDIRREQITFWPLLSLPLVHMRFEYIIYRNIQYAIQSSKRFFVHSGLMCDHKGNELPRTEVLTTRSTRLTLSFVGPRQS